MDKIPCRIQNVGPGVPLAVTEADIRFPLRSAYRLYFLGLLLAMVYLLILLPGINGLILTLLALAVVCISVNRETLGVFCLLMCPLLAGFLFRSFGIPHVGSVMSLLIGFALLFGFKLRSKIASAQWEAPALWLLLTISVLFISYLMGPQTEYCQAKFIMFVTGLVLEVITFRFIIGSNLINLWSLGLMAVVSSVVHYSTTAYNWPGIIPSNIFIPCGIRGTDIELLKEARPVYAGLLACFGVMCLLSNSIQKQFKRIHYLQMFLAMTIAMLVINSIGQRLYIVTVFLAGLLLLLYRPADRVLAGAVALIMIGACAAMVTFGIAKGATQLIQTFTTEQSTIDERLNRSINWGPAIRRIKEKPFFGHGLGGYYLDEWTICTEPGEEAYAHNLFLELLSETGFVGTILIVFPVIIFWFIPAGRQVFLFRTKTGDAPVFLLLYAFCHAMITRDLRESHLLFAIIAVMWAYIPVGRFNKP